ncbi:hypothetical protein BHM03_00032282 [Ensete ventricosum]|nr:hypothetical protein BHM03_00032282 [Ensete ventricosum]
MKEEGLADGNSRCDKGGRRRGAAVTAAMTRATHIGVAGKRALGPASGWQAMRATTDVVASGEEWLVIAIKEESKAAMKKVGWKWLGSGKGCAAAATTKEEGKITRRSAAVVVVCRNRGGGGRLL